MTYSIVKRCRMCGLPFPAEDEDEMACEACWDRAIAEIEFIARPPLTDRIQ